MLLFRFSAVRGWSIFVIYSNFENLTPSAVYVSVAQVIEMRGLSKDAPMRIAKKLPPPPTFWQNRRRRLALLLAPSP